MGGILEFIEEGWTDDISGSLSKTTFEKALAAPLRYTKDGRAEKYCFLGSDVFPVISGLYD